MGEQSGAYVIKPQEIQGDPKRIFFDGQGLIRQYFHTERLMMCQFELLPGHSLPIDIHPDGDEGYYVAQGTVTVLLPDTGEIHQIRAGEAYYIPAGVRHQASNQNEERVIVVAAIAPKVK